jgi:hypothetical protein
VICTFIHRDERRTQTAMKWGKEYCIHCVRCSESDAIRSVRVTRYIWGINQKMYVHIHFLHYIRNHLPLSSTIFLFVNNSLHAKEKGVFWRESNQDDYVASYRNTGSLHLIALVWLYCRFTARCTKSCSDNSSIHDA